MAESVQQELEGARRLEERLRMALEATGLETWDYDPRSGMVTCSERAKSWWGLSPEASTYQAWLAGLHPDDCDAVVAAVRRSLDPAGSGRQDTEYRVIQADGTLRWVSVMAQTYFGDVDGRREALRVLGTVQDVTERKQMEESFQWELCVNAAQARLSRMLIASTTSIDQLARTVLEYSQRLTGSEHGFVSIVDPETRMNIGLTLSDMTTRQCRVPGAAISLAPGPDGQYPSLAGHAMNIREAFYTNSPATHPFATGTPEGHVPIKALLSVPAIVAGELVGQITLANPGRCYTDRDLEAIRRLASLYAVFLRRLRDEEELKRAKAAAESANQAKSRFLANMSHEIRTPMTAVLGFTDLLLQTECSAEEQREYLGIVQQSGKSLLQLIDDILDLAKIEAGRICLQTADCELARVVEEITSLMWVRAKEKGFPLELRYHDPLPVVIRTDSARLRQILLNLVGNAIKFTERGHVRIEVWWAMEPGGPKVRFVVSDTGIGISSAQLEEVFHPFNQGDSSPNRRFGGTGLGLTISRRLARMLGGDLTVDSRPGEGSRFTLTIDAGDVAQATLVQVSATARPSPEAEASPCWSGRVLVVEDSRSNQQLIRAMLGKTGLKIDEAGNGEEACQKAIVSAAEGRPYELILMDIEMPDLDGYQAARRLRELGWAGPIVAVTADVMAGDREKCLEAGCDDYIAKPICRDSLLEIVGRRLER